MSISQIIKGKPQSAHEDHWISLSDLMTGLMLMFILIAITFMVKVEADGRESMQLKEQAELKAKQLQELIPINETLKEEAELKARQLQQFAVLYDDVREQLYMELLTEFKNDLRRWHAVLETDMSIRFEEPEGQFKTAQSALSDEFKAILNDFIPRYVAILASERYRESIEEIRIEGHTSSVWRDKSDFDAYILNMELSQSRTRTTLAYALTRPGLGNNLNWLKSKLTANGLSSSRLRFKNGAEDIKASQRVEFRVRLNADARMKEMLERAQK